MTFSRSDLPEDFVFGTATAAYQVEGATTEGGRGRSIWDDFAETPGAIADGRTGEPADDHFHRFRDDVEVMSGLGFDAYRFSVSWSRIQPEGKGPANPDGVAFYRALAESLIARGITPYATLYHWDLPSALEASGGWLNRDTADRFAEYARVVVAALGDLVTHWITLNEPWCSAFLGYAAGVHAPGRRVGSEASHAAHHLLLGHGRAVAAIRELSPEATVGVTLNLYSVEPTSEDPADVDAARRIDGLQNRLFLDPVLRGSYPDDVLADLGEQDWFAANPATDAQEIAAPIDFLGINYYSRHTVRAGSAPMEGSASAHPGSEFVEMVDTGAVKTQMGWEIHPDGLIDVLRMAHALKPDLPLYVTENGAAYDDVLANGVVADEERRDYLEKHLTACAVAVAAGIPLTGYFAWSLMDNFEWAFGYTRRFGIVHVDYESQVRTVKNSGHWFAGILGGPLASSSGEATA